MARLAVAGVPLRAPGALAAAVLLLLLIGGARCARPSPGDGGGGDGRDEVAESAAGRKAGEEEEEDEPAAAVTAATGSSLPDCSHACGPCSPCRRVMVTFQCSVAESCPIVYRCMCKGRYYQVPSS